MYGVATPGSRTISGSPLLALLNFFSALRPWFMLVCVSLMEHQRAKEHCVMSCIAYCPWPLPQTRQPSLPAGFLEKEKKKYFFFYS